MGRAHIYTGQLYTGTKSSCQEISELAGKQASVCTIKIFVMVHQIMVSFEKASGHNFFKLPLKIYTLI